MAQKMNYICTNPTYIIAIRPLRDERICEEYISKSFPTVKHVLTGLHLIVTTL